MSTEGKLREVEEVLLARLASDGDGVQLKRVFGGSNLERFDPFLMLDEFGSDEASDYIGGFPPHPHRGFETVTYMLEGHMEHRDHMGNIGNLSPGSVQWMKAGSGVIHSEMPQQEEGRMHGFQLWLNLPGAEKMSPASYDDLEAETIPVFRVGDARIKAIAGTLTAQDTELKGAVSRPSTDPSYLDIEFEQSQTLDLDIPSGYTTLVYAYLGSLTIGDSEYPLTSGSMARLSREGTLRLEAQKGSKVLVLSGKPLGEPIAHRGPFVMNTMEEIHQAIRDYSEGTLVEKQV